MISNAPIIRKSYFILLTILIFNSISAIAEEKFYKWTDDKGQIHYSQIAPASKDDAAGTISKIGGKSNSLKMQPYQKGRYLYCGKLELPQAHLTDALILKNIKLGLKEWSQEQREAEIQYNKLKTSQRDKTKFIRAKKWFEETSCRITWAHKRLNFLTSSAYKRSLELDKIKKQYDILEKARNKECPENPKLHGFGENRTNSNPNFIVGAEAEDFHQCGLRYDKKMKPLKNKLREYNRK